MLTRLFERASLPEFESAPVSVAGDLIQRLATTMDAHALGFTLLWTKGLALDIAGLHVRTLQASGTTPWQPLLARQTIADSGEFTHALGYFIPGQRVEVMIVAMALEADVPRALGAVTELPGPRVTQVIPAPPATTLALARGVTWIQSGSYQL